LLVPGFGIDLTVASDKILYLNERIICPGWLRIYIHSLKIGKGKYLADIVKIPITDQQIFFCSAKKEISSFWSFY